MHDTAEPWPFSTASAIFQIVTCAQCGEREAIVFIRRSGGPSEGCDIMLCEACAGNRGIIAGNGSLELNIDDLVGAGLDPASSAGSPATCPTCGLDLTALRREGRLGCANCAGIFTEEIVKAIGRKPRIDLGYEASAVRANETAPRLRRDLESALDSEDYETAAKLRDELSRLEGSEDELLRLGSGSNFPFEPYPPRIDRGPEDDVVLRSSARVYRNLVGLPFPGSPHGPSSPSRDVLRDRFLAMGEWKASTMAELGGVGRRSLAERGIVSRGYAADDSSLIIASAADRTYALLDEGDHLRIATVVPGLDPGAAMAPAQAAAAGLGKKLDFARRPGIGWICSRVEDCGLGCMLSASVHIPALTAAGMRDRLFRAIMADGVAVRGYYSSSEESAGSVYEIGIESTAFDSVAALVEAFSLAASKVVAAERRARSEIAARGRVALADAEGRAFGVTRYFSLAGIEEAASLLSVLRLSALRGSLRGVDHRSLGTLLLALGAGSISLSSGLAEIPGTDDQEACRAGIVKEALSGAEYRVEGGA